MTRLFLLILALVFGGAIFWADHATLDEVTRGDGRVIPSSQIQIVQSLEGGIVKDILVSEGELVDAGQVLMRIDDTSVSSSLGELQVQRGHLTAVIARLTAEAEGAETFTVPEEVFSRTPQIVEQERELFEDRQRELNNEIRILEQQLEQRRRELTDLQLQETSVAQSLGLAQQQLGIIWPLVQTGVVPRTEALDLQRDVNDLQGELDQARNGIPRAEASIAEAESRIEDARLSFRSEARAELNQRRADLLVIEESMRAAQDRVVRTDIRSPVKGIVNTVNVTTIGGVFQPGQHLFEIVPIEDSLLVEARVRPSDVAFLRPDLDAMVKISAYDFAIYGGLPGHIERISADTIVDEATGESFYRVIVRTDQNYLGTDDHPLPIIPGMVATVDILTGHKTVLDYLLKPIERGSAEALRER
ncbi:MAG: HlyD family type I secretion periplasmic adaptor subunit [Rhodospirillaceae bacterium]|nr:HlyD family type I secretion periplasmic adaptor subunit [Rhodospirillaceae bacterium]